jgi:transposase-like protein
MNAKAAISTAAITKATIIRVPSPPQDMKSIYWLENKEGLQEASKGFSEAMKWWEMVGKRSPYVSTCLKYPEEIRPYIYATNAQRDS